MKRIIFLFAFIAFSFSGIVAQFSDITVSDATFYPEDITIANNIAYVSSLGDGSVRSFDLTQANPTGETFAVAEAGYTQAWGLKVVKGGTSLLSILDNADFGGGISGAAKLVEYDIATRTKTGEWDLPTGSIGHTVSMVDGKYYVGDFSQPRIFEIDPATNTVNDSWFTSTEWDPAISGMGGMIYDNQGGFYASQGEKLWYLPIADGMPGTLQQVTVDGLDVIDADGISWDDTKNILYFATNDTGNPDDAGTASRVVFSDPVTATGSVIASDFDDSSGLWFHRDGGNEYIFVLESQFGALFGINGYEAPFNIDVIQLPSSSDNTVSVYNSFEDATLTGGVQGFFGAAGPVGISDDLEFANFIGFYDIDVSDFGVEMTLVDNSGAADILLPDGRFDRYYFNYDGDVSNLSISGGSAGLTVNASVSALPAGYEVPVQDLFGTGYPLPITLPEGGFVIELGGGTDLTELGQTLSVSFGNTGVSVYNSFEDATLTGGVQGFFGAAGPEVVSNELEFPNFIGFYDIDVTDFGVEMTLVDNSGAADILLPDGRFDRYYFNYDGDVSNLSISGGSAGLTVNTSVSALPPGYEVPVQDLFGTGYPLPITLPDGGFVIELAGGTDLTELGQTLSVSFGNTGISVYNSFEDATLTGGVQGFFGAAGPEVVNDDLEFPNFIGFYDIDVTDFGVEMTLVDNSGAADILLPDGRFDRYYFAYDGDVSNISIAGGSAGLTVNASVSALPAGYEVPVQDLFGTGYPLPITLPDGGFVIELGGGTDLTELGQTLSVDFGYTGVTVYNSFEDATLTGGVQGFFGAAGPEPISDKLEFPNFIGFYDIDLSECGVKMTLIDNSGAADVLLPDGRFDRYYFAYDGDVSNLSISGGSAGLTVNASVSALPAGYEVPVQDLFGTGYPLPITLPDGGFVIELGGGTDLTELGQTLTVDFGCPVPDGLIVNDNVFFPEDIVIANDIAYVSGLGDGTLRTFDLTESNPTAQPFAAAEAGYTQRWGVKVVKGGTALVSILDNADFGGGMSGPAKLVEYDIATQAKTAEWDLPAGSIGHTVSMVDGKYYVGDFGQPRIFEIDPAAGTVNDSWFTSTEWDPAISGMGGMIYDNEGGFYASQGNKLWYLPITGGTPGTLQEVTIDGLDAVDADGISWDDTNNTLYYATNDTGDPANVGTVYELVFSDTTNAKGKVIASGFDDSSGLWYYENEGARYVFVLESQFGALFGINGFEAPFNIAIIELADGTPDNLTSDDLDFFPEDIVIANNIAYVSGLGDGTVKTFNLNEAYAEGVTFAEAEDGYTQAWGLKVVKGGTALVSILDNADFGGGMSGPAKLVEYDIATKTKTAEWDLPAGSIGHTVSMVDGKYYVGDFGQPRIFEIDPAAGTVNDSWFTSTEWDPAISGMGGIIYDNEGGFYASQGNKLWYLPIAGGTPGTLQEVTIDGLDAVDADGISWDDTNNTLYYATNDTGDPADVGTVYELVFSDATNATGKVIATGLDDSSGLWYYENDGARYVFVLESQFGALFGINGFEAPFNIEIIELADGTPDNLTSDDLDFFPEDIVIANNIAYVSGLGDGTVKTFNLNEANPEGVIFAEAETGYTQAWGVKVVKGGTALVSLLNNADFGGGISGPAKLVEYDIATKTKTAEWDLPAGSIGHTVSMVDGKYYVGDFGQPRIFEIDPAAGTVNDSWFTSTEWDPAISGMGGIIYDNEGGFYASQGNKLWYLPIAGGTPGTLAEVTIDGLDAVDADGISWDATNNILYYATNDTGDPDDVGTVYELVFFDATFAVGKEIASGLDDSSGLWYYENDGERYAVVLESQFGGLFGINSFDPPFNIEFIPLGMVSSTQNEISSINSVKVFPNPFKEVTNFEIELVEGGLFLLQVFNAKAELVTNNSLRLNEGINIIPFNGESLSTGIYTYRLVNKTGFKSGKIILIK